MLSKYQVTFTVYNNSEKSSWDSGMHMITTQVETLLPQQAQSLVEAQYAGRAHVWMVTQVS